MSTTYKQRHRMAELEHEVAERRVQCDRLYKELARAESAAREARNWLGELLSSHIRLSARREQNRQVYAVKVEVSEEMMMLARQGEDQIAYMLGKQIAASLTRTSPAPSALFVHDGFACAPDGEE